MCPLSSCISFHVDRRGIFILCFPIEKWGPFGGSKNNVTAKNTPNLVGYSFLCFDFFAFWRFQGSKYFVDNPRYLAYLGSNPQYLLRVISSYPQNILRILSFLLERGISAPSLEDKSSEHFEDLPSKYFEAFPFVQGGGRGMLRILPVGSQFPAFHKLNLQHPQKFVLWELCSFKGL